jgi:nucleotide-binding universal stress UspA family protein
MVLGSVAAEVVDGTPRSVLVARGGRISRAVIATDGSPCSGVIPQVLADMEVFEAMPTVAVSVAPVDSRVFEILATISTLGAEPIAEQRDELVARHRGYADAMAGRLTEVGIPATAEVRSGDAAREIIAAAAEHEADLVVTGSRTLQGTDRFFLGSVAHNVLVHASTSVLVVRCRVPSAAAEPAS